MERRKNKRDGKECLNDRIVHRVIDLWINRVINQKKYNEKEKEN